MTEHGNQKDCHLLVFTDLDGTLLDHETHSFKRALPAIKILKEKNIPLIFSTSKTRAEIEEVKPQLDNLILASGNGPSGWSKALLKLLNKLL